MKTILALLILASWPHAAAASMDWERLRGEREDADVLALNIAADVARRRSAPSAPAPRRPSRAGRFRRAK